MSTRALPDWCADCVERERDRLDREPKRQWDAEGHEIGGEDDGEGEDNS